MKIELTIEQLNNFLKKLSPRTTVKDKALTKISGILKKTNSPSNLVTSFISIKSTLLFMSDIFIVLLLFL